MTVKPSDSSIASAALNRSAHRTPAPANGCSDQKLRQLARRVSRHFDPIVGDAGLKTSQYALLMHIVTMEPVRPGELADHLQMDASTLSRNLQPLVVRGWVAVGPGDDARSRFVTATEAGRAKRIEAQSEWRRAQRAFNARLGEDRVARLHALIDECLAALDATDQPG